MKKLTQSEFITKAKEVNPNLDFSKSIYINRRTKIIVTCPIHGDFEMLAGSFLRPVTCPKCDLEQRKQYFIKKAKEIHKDKYNYSLINYQTNKIPVEIICPEHGIFKQAPGDHLKGYGCSKCSKKYKPTTEEWIESAKKVHPNYDYSDVIYKDNKSLISITCLKHNYKFSIIPNNFIKQQCPCSKCQSEYKHDIYAKTTEQFIKDSKQIHGDKYDYSKVNYYNKSTKVTIICPEHGEFNQIPSVHLEGHGCPKCIHKNQTILWEKLCKKFPNEDILYEVGNDIVSWIDSLRFDIYFPKYNIAVEYDGEQHFTPIKYFGGEMNFELTKQRDCYKNKLCKENNCYLFRIKYNYNESDLTDLFNQIETIIENHQNSY